MSRLDIDAYQSAVQAASICANLLAQHDIPKLLEAISRADAIGPILDPTLYRDKQVVMHEDEELLRAALRLSGFATKRKGGT